MSVREELLEKLRHWRKHFQDEGQRLTWEGLGYLISILEDHAEYEKEFVVLRAEVERLTEEKADLEEALQVAGTYGTREEVERLRAENQGLQEELLTRQYVAPKAEAEWEKEAPE